MVVTPNAVDPEGAHDDMRRDFGDFRRGVSAVLFGSGARTVARLTLIFFVVTYYGVESFGYLGEVAAIVELSAAFANLGLPKSLFGYLEQHRREGADQGALIGEACLATLLTGGLLAAGIWLLWPYIFPTAAGVPAYVAGAIVLIAVTEILLTVTRSARLMRWDMMAKGVVKPWGFLLLAALGYAGGVYALGWPPVQTLFVSYLLSLAITGIFAVAGFVMVLRDQHISLRYTSMSKVLQLIRRTFPTALLDTCSYGYRRLDIIMLGLVAGPAATGVYYLAQQLATVVEKVRHLFEPMASPIFAQASSDEHVGHYLRKLCLWIFSIQLGLALLFLLFTGPVMAVAGAGMVLLPALFAFVLAAEIMEGGTGLIELPLIFRRPVLASRNAIIAITVEILTIVPLTYLFQGVGAAAGFFCGMLTLSILRLRYAREVLGTRLLNSSYIWPILAAGAIAGAVLGVMHIVKWPGPVLLAIMISGSLGAYLLFLRAFGIDLKLKPAS